MLMMVHRKPLPRRLLKPASPILLPLYTWLAKVQRLDPGRQTFRDVAGREVADDRLFITPDSGLAVILALGASNIANEADPNGLIVPHQGVYNFNFLDGRCYVAKDPLLGATQQRSNLLTRLGDLLARRGLYERVLLVPIAYGGTYARDWAPKGTMHPRLRRTIRMLRRRNISVTHVLWQQGEAEAAMPNANPEEWTKHFCRTLPVIRGAFPDAPIYVAQCTICRSSPNNVIRAAQCSVVNPSKKIFAGPDLDVIGLDDRWDQCHFSIAGLKKAAALWFERIVNDKQFQRLNASS
jgi:hypothetical protein